MFFGFGCKDAGDVFGVCIHDATEEGELDEVEAEVGVFRGGHPRRAR